MKHAESKCMFCLRDDRSFRSEEHVLPESLGNKTTLVPRGVICDHCNNGPLSVCDQALVNCPPISLLKTAQFIRNKKNKLPRAKFDGAGLYAIDIGDGTGSVYMRLPDEGAFADGDGEFAIELVKPWNQKQWSLVSRAILKAGFEMLAIDFGKAYVMDERFDGLRKAILEGGFSGWVLYNSTGEPSSELSLVYPPFDIQGTGRAGLTAGVTIYGMRMTTAWPGREDLLAQVPDVPETDDLRFVRFHREPTTDRDDITMTVTVTYGSREEWTEDGPMDAAIAKLDAL